MIWIFFVVPLEPAACFAPLSLPHALMGCLIYFPPLAEAFPILACLTAGGAKCRAAFCLVLRPTSNQTRFQHLGWQIFNPSGYRVFLPKGLLKIF
jgi:hypothetical protein